MDHPSSHPPFDPSLSISPNNPCPFCLIAYNYPYLHPTDPPHPSSPDVDPSKCDPPAFVVLSTTLLIAFLDIQPLTPGHILLCPRRHRPRLSDVSPAEAAELGRYQRLLSKALVRATGVRDWNVVNNNGEAAAQVVGHCHFHIIPRPELRGEHGGFIGDSQGGEKERRQAKTRMWTMFGRGQRDSLDDEDGFEMAEDIRLALAEVMVEEGSMDTPKWKL